MSLSKAKKLKIDYIFCLSVGTFFVYITCLVSVPFAFQLLIEFSMFTKMAKERFMAEWGQEGSLIVRRT